MNKKEPCLLPWVELHLSTAGQLKTCCAQIDYLEKNLGNSFSEIFNGPTFNSIRDQFLAGKTPDVCKACVQAEDNQMSYKTVKSAEWKHQATDLMSTYQQGKKLPVRFLDLRFGNLCNFSCRTCDSYNSSRWQKIDSYVGRTTHASVHVTKQKLQEQIFSVIDEVEEIYFAGGEPLLAEEHYLVLEELIRRGKTSIKITYNTNLSVLGGFSRNVLDLWKHFDQLKIYPSIDSIKEQGEYIRPGFKWEKFVENFHQVKSYIGCLHSVLSAYNVFSIGELLTWAVEKNVLLSIFPAYHPTEISASILPQDVREKAAKNLEDIASNLHVNPWQASQVNTAVQFLRKNSTPEHSGRFLEFNRSLDGYYNSDLLRHFPEHSEWISLYERK